MLTTYFGAVKFRDIIANFRDTRQMTQVSPLVGLTHPGFQGRVEVGVFFTAFDDLSGI